MVIGSRGGIFSGSCVNGPDGRLTLTGLYPLHDAGTIFVPSWLVAPLFLLPDAAVVVGSLLFLCRQAARTWLNRTLSFNILKMLRSNILATMILAMFLPCLADARS